MGEDARISSKQLNYIVALGKGLKLNSKDLDQDPMKTYGVKTAFLTSLCFVVLNDYRLDKESHLSGLVQKLF